uniref:Uncharacterized protein n=2 Tax=Anguilla anguilla TaxID=7936 RepID=A0A0E9U0E8_ANGAN
MKVMIILGIRGPNATKHYCHVHSTNLGCINRLGIQQ